jgi:hypothetical protein
MCNWGLSDVVEPELKNRLKRALSLAAFLMLAAQGAEAGLANAGFEAGVEDGLPASWDHSGPNEVVVVDSEGSGEFDVYGPGGFNEAVSAYRGNLMLRLGKPEAPGDQNNNQTDGITSVSQFFTATGPTLGLSMRVFTTEFRPNRDSVRVRLTDGDLTDVSMTLTGAHASCSGAECTVRLDAGRNGDIVGDAEWRTLTITGLSGSYTIHYELVTGSGSSHPSWVYFDDVNQPPIAAFTCNPGGQPGTVALEGDFIGCDASASSDPDGDDITFEWTVTSTVAAPIQLAGEVAGFYAPADGDYTITLSASDGTSISTVTNEDSLVIAPTTVGNAAPIVSAIKVVETLDVATLRCRGVDPGAEDTHEATFSIDGTSPTATLLEENEPAYATFVATAPFDASSLAPDDYPGSCTFTDTADSSSFGTDTFTLRVLDPSELVNRFEPNDSSEPSPGEPPVPTIDAGRTTQALLETAADVDIYELRMANGTVPPTNAEFRIDLKMPADYDAVLLSRPVPGQSSTVFESAPFVSFPFVSFPFVSFPFVSFGGETAPFVSFPFVSFPFVSFPQQTAPFVSFPFVSFPFVSFPFETSPFVSFGFTVEDFPLSQMVDAPDGSKSSGDILGLGELGSLNLSAFENENLRVKDVSANFNTAEDPGETLFGVKTADEEAIFLAVLSFDGALSPEPYEFTVEASKPLDTEAFLDSSCEASSPNCNCSGTPLVSSPVAGEEIRAGSSPTTLIVTQRQRIQQLEGLTDTQWNQFVTDITPWMNAVDARFISVDSDLFDDWDEHPCDINSLDALADALGNVVKTELEGSSITSVIILGDFDVWPSDSEVDFTQIGNEGLFLGQLPVRPETPIATVFRAGHFLSDACFTDSDPIPFNGGLFCIEDVPTGRMVSTTRLVEQSLTGGIISYANGLVSGYEFFSDVAGSMSNSLTNLGGSLSVLNNETWTSAQLEPQWCAVNPDVAGVQGHASFNAVLAAGGFSIHDFTDVTTADECMGGDPNTLTASIGCHTLTFVPASSALPAEFFPEDQPPSLTWADRPGTWVGTYAFGLGHTDTDDLGTEGILKRFFACIGANATVEPPLSVGSCLLNAKIDYLQSRTSIDAYDVKSVMTLAVSGIPDVTVVPSATEGAAMLAAYGEQLLAATCPDGSTPAPFNLTVDGVYSEHALCEVVVPGKGTYDTVDGGYQAGTGRPYLATLKVRSGIVNEGETADRSMSLREGDYDLLINHDPVVANSKTEWIDPASEVESRACINTMSPTELGVFNQLPVDGERVVTFNLTIEQFECLLPPEDRGVVDTIGNLRRFTDLVAEVKQPPTLALEADLNPPDVLRRDIVLNATTGEAFAVVDASDENNLAEINVLVYEENRVNGGPGQLRSFSTGDISADDNSDPALPGDPYVVPLNAPGEQWCSTDPDVSCFVAIEYFDKAANKILKSGKGILVEAVQVIILNTSFNVGSDTIVRTEIERLNEFLDTGLTVAIDYGDGTQEEFFLDSSSICGAELTTDCVTILEDGSTGVFETTHMFEGGADSYTVTVSVRGPASGYDEAVLTLCADDTGETAPDGDIEYCAFNAQGTNVDIDMYVVGQIDSDTFKYRVQVFGEQFQYAKERLSTPPGVQATATILDGGKGLRISFDAGAWWDGTTSFTVEQTTQDGVKKGQSQGETDSNFFEASVGEPGI